MEEEKMLFFFKSLFENTSFCQIQESYKDSSWYGFSLILSGNLKKEKKVCN